MVHPIIDEYYNYNPSHSRSSKFAQDKGLVTNEKGTSTPAHSSTPARSSTPTRPELYRLRSTLGSSLHESLASTLVPSMHVAISPALSPTTENLPSLPSLSTRDSNRPQEMTNTKKKRKSPITREREPQAQAEAVEPVPDSPPPQRTAYGDPNKIAQYFPELN
jgi:glutamine amidotransferase